MTAGLFAFGKQAMRLIRPRWQVFRRDRRGTSSLACGQSRKILSISEAGLLKPKHGDRLETLLIVAIGIVVVVHLGLVLAGLIDALR